MTYATDTHLASPESRVTKPHAWGYGSTPRTAKLRDALVWKAGVVKDFFSIAAGLSKCTFRDGVRINMDRARLVTDAYRDTVGQPWALCQAEAMKRICEEMPIYIAPGELIAGDPNGAPDEIRWHPEISVSWVREALTTGGFSNMANDVDRKEIMDDICTFWDERARSARIHRSHPQGLKGLTTALATSVSCLAWEGSRTVPIYDFETYYEQGVEGRIAVAEAKLAELEDKSYEMSPAEYLEKRHTWEAMVTCGKAILRYAERHAELAREMAEDETDHARRAELEEMARIFDRVPAKPPQTFHECLQFYWVIEVVAHYLAVCGNGSGQRIDQIWWPYYQADIEAGRITREQALELIECLFIKIQGLGSPLEIPLIFSVATGIDIIYTAHIGGSDGYGRDLSNELTMMCMDALENLHVNQPPLALRYHRNIAPEVVERAIDLTATGMGHPSFFNEDLIEKWALTRGHPPEEAKNAVVCGCVLPGLPSNPNSATGIFNIGAVVSPKLLEEILGLWEPPDVPGELNQVDPTQLQSADELFDAVIERFEFHAKLVLTSWNIAHEVTQEYFPEPCNSFLYNECLERGVGLHKVAKERDSYPNLICFGAINLSNSFAAMDKLVFQEGKYSMEELLEALRANWDGFEEMRQDFLRAPKYGNDDDFADAWAQKYLTRLVESAGKLKDAWGHPLTFEGSTAAAYQGVGLSCGASPDGRFAMDSLADGSVSPTFGTDTNGPTATLNSIAKIPFMFPQLANQRFMPTFLKGENKRVFADYLREWFETGCIWHIQFNVVDSTVLRDAQEHPEFYGDLQIRVAGYSAFWVDIPKQIQDSIIGRCEHSFEGGC